MKNAVLRDLLPTASSMETTHLASIKLPPHADRRQVGLHKLIILLSKLLEDGVQHQVDGSAAVDEHLGDRLFVDVTSNI
jgi:hypothetical protein